MSDPTPRFRQIFFEVFESLPRQGPGSRACAAKALALCRDLPPAPAVLDLGCGVGGMISIHQCSSTSRISAADTPTTAKRSPCWINSRRSPRCTGDTPTTMPMSSSWCAGRGE